MKAKSKSRRKPRANPAPRTRAVSPEFFDEIFAKTFACGRDHFNSRRFFEAHESWEEIWLKSRGVERRRLQGIIQIAAAFHHHSRDNLAGTESLLRAGLSKIEDAPAAHWGLQLDPLRVSVRRWIALFEEGEQVAGKIPPKILRAR